MLDHGSPFLTADDLCAIARHTSLTFTDEQHAQADALLSGLAAITIDPSKHDAAAGLAATVLVLLHSARIDTDLLIRGVELQLRLLGFPVAYRGLLITVLEQLVDTGLDFRLSTDELIQRAAPLIAQTI